jgi:hypothetical protein
VETKSPARIEAYKAAGGGLPLPELTVPHLYTWLMEAGPIESGAMGSAPLGWPTIRAWAEQTFTPMSAWEARTLRQMSIRYFSELHAAEDPHRPAPFWPARGMADHDANERQLRAVLG